MHFKNYEWNVEKLNGLRDQIDPKPQYQRGDAWDDRKRALLIDSVLKNFDIPKIYLRHSKHISPFDYEAADGQQRLKAIWRFLDGQLVLEGMTDEHSHLNGRTFCDLSEQEQHHIMQYAFVTTVVYNASTDQVRELFRRLQLGVRLNPAELRNSMASALGNEIRAMALTHPFFKNSAFTSARYKADDLLGHAFAILIYKRKRDIKAADLKVMYLEHDANVDAAYSKQLNAMLHVMDAMQRHKAGCIKTKWGFVDLVSVLAGRNLKTLDANAFADAYSDWEVERAQKVGRLAQLAAARAGSRDRQLFDYITAFQKEGATKKHLESRYGVLNSVLP
ncbi:MAG: DUF262 domain-containing protein [Limisphaerales bacterium]